MKISLDGVAKRYGRHWLFTNAFCEFETGCSYAILGKNGSGKSTLLRVIGGMQTFSSGALTYRCNDKLLDPSQVFKLTSYCAPGMELPEEMTLEEALKFHFTFKTPLKGFEPPRIIEEIGLGAFATQPIGDYSSGMRQRVKLAQAIFSDTPLLLLDEPCTNLDDAGVSQYQRWMKQYSPGRLVIVASNDEREYAFCDHRIEMQELA